MSVADFAFYVFALTTIAGGMFTVLSRNPVHSVLWLITAFVGSAGLFVLLGAEFLAMLLMIVYIGAVVYWAVAGDRSATMAEWATILILIGLFFTVLGTWWHPLRGALMRLLPDFPGKSRLPPYSERS